MIEILIAALVCFLIGSLGCLITIFIIGKLFSLSRGYSMLAGVVIYPIVIIALVATLVKSWPPNVDGVQLLGVSVLGIMVGAFGLIGGPLAFIALVKERE